MDINSDPDLTPKYVWHQNLLGEMVDDLLDIVLEKRYLLLPENISHKASSFDLIYTRIPGIVTY